ncbi:NAD(P)-dependent dehydrogenase, short-chain alcohol dehydrogenase family [Flavobacterium segetis]|uniref:NAD(P)-dependent dehydrogenase, short-chain alcohol dehydrogenase family n=1 Tax=Flavobacterium segetis TaxID=271157 RepID=A0A1M5EMX9_9FLAO|nr:SDR family oxidoreductase [Flavobacterium segetis]SHF80470.1 NAD(P)-dependent dehydrogenase, short-chain alcohol dehydrogenase family [Flavobacterium segetis]
MKRLKNKVAIITGGAGSIGKITAQLFLEEGAKVMLIDLDKESLKKTIKELNSVDVKYCVADVTKAIDVQNYIDETVQVFGKIDVFFNNAGIEGGVKPIEDYPEEIFDKVIAVNVKGMWLGNKYAIPHMHDGGSIIMTSSVAGILGSANMSAYIISKHAVVGIMRNAAIELAPRKIRVNTINPSPVNNRMMRSIEEGVSSGNAAQVQQDFEATIPLKRYAEPEEIAKLVLFLASDDSQFITGTIQLIDGGLSVQ